MHFPLFLAIKLGKTVTVRSTYKQATVTNKDTCASLNIINSQNFSTHLIKTSHINHLCMKKKHGMLKNGQSKHGSPVKSEKRKRRKPKFWPSRMPAAKEQCIHPSILMQLSYAEALNTECQSTERTVPFYLQFLAIRSSLTPWRYRIGKIVCACYIEHSSCLVKENSLAN